MVSCCEHCGKRFQKNFVLYRHIREVHKVKCVKRLNDLVNKKFSCEQCRTKFKSTSTLNRHIRNKHSNCGTAMTCASCGSESPLFTSKKGLLKHLGRNHPEQVQNRSLSHSNSSVIHVSSPHKKYFMYRCSRLIFLPLCAPLLGPEYSNRSIKSKSMYLHERISNWSDLLHTEINERKSSVYDVRRSVEDY